MSVKVVEYIWCDESRQGAGTKDDPVRLVPQLWTKEGRLVAQYDPEDPSQTFFRPYPESWEQDLKNLGVRPDY